MGRISYVLLVKLVYGKISKVRIVRIVLLSEFD